MKKAARFNEVTAARTAWFPEGIKPAKPGVYETQFKAGRITAHGRSHWNGARWSEQGGAMRHVWCAFQGKQWRGLAADPRATA